MVKTFMSYGGGLNSSAMLRLLETRDELPDVVLFSDTGDESETTYEMVKFFQAWCRERSIRFEILRSHLAPSLLDFSFSNRSIPSRMRRECSFKFKVRPIRKWINQEYPKEPTCDCDREARNDPKYRPHRFHALIGIARDEGHRAKDSDVWYILNQYPLVEDRITRQGCADLLEAAGLPIPPKSGCFYCPLQPKRKWIQLLRDDPGLFDQAQRMEENGQRFPELTLFTRPLATIRLEYQGQTYFDVGGEEDERDIVCDIGGCWS